jgi:2Fe-2S ferredoxin
LTKLLEQQIEAGGVRGLVQSGGHVLKPPLPEPVGHRLAFRLPGQDVYWDDQHAPFDGETFEVTAEVGSTVMENGIRAMVPGIEAECGGACACATCHVYVDDAFAEIVGGPSPMEEDMLDFAYDVRPTSRLSCQIKVSEALDGLVVRVPERQG